MARTKNPSAATTKAWRTRRRNARVSAKIKSKPKVAKPKAVGRLKAVKGGPKPKAAKRKPTTFNTKGIWSIDPKTRKSTKIPFVKGQKAPLLQKFREKLAARKARGAKAAAEWRAIVRGGKRGGLENLTNAKWRRSAR